MDNQIKEKLKESYDSTAKFRDDSEMALWKVGEMNKFLSYLKPVGQLRLLDIGSGPGHHGKYFNDKGLNVTCVDISPNMVRACREKSLEAYVMDFYSLNFDEEKFDAVWSMNCLLHVPKSSLVSVLKNIKNIMKSGGYFYMGVYGGYDFEGVWEEDAYTPKRFFSFYETDEIKKVVGKEFEIISFEIVPLGSKREEYQSIILRKV